MTKDDQEFWDHCVTTIMPSVFELAKGQVMPGETILTERIAKQTAMVADAMLKERNARKAKANG